MSTKKEVKEAKEVKAAEAKEAKEAKVAEAKAAKEAKRMFRDLRVADEDGTLDKIFYDNAGMKLFQLQSAKDGLIITAYDYSTDIPPVKKFISTEDLLQLLVEKL